MSQLKTLIVSLGDKAKWVAAKSKLPKTSPLEDLGIDDGCERIAAMGKAVRWDRIYPSSHLKASPEQLADDKLQKQFRGDVNAEYDKLNLIQKALDAQAKRAKDLTARYGNKAPGYLPVLQYAKVVLAETPKLAGLIAATEKEELKALDATFAKALDAKTRDAKEDMKADDKRIRDAASARLTAAGAVVQLEKTAATLRQITDKAAAAAAAGKSDAKAMIAQGRKLVEVGVGEMKKAAVSRSELETAIKALTAQAFHPATAANGKEETTRCQKVAAELKAKQEAAEKTLGEARRELEMLAKKVK
jgi:hypothetical protein